MPLCKPDMFGNRLFFVNSLIIIILASSSIDTTHKKAQAEISTDWPQLGHDPQRSNASPVQVDPPYCYAWKWIGVPFASRAQPVVSSGRLFLGGMDGWMYARDSKSGAPLWEFDAGSPIRHSAGVADDLVIFTTHAGKTFALQTSSGETAWTAETGSSQTAPLIDPDGSRVVVASTSGLVTSLDLQSGRLLWTYKAGAPVLTTPALSEDRSLVFLGSEDLTAFALHTKTGKLAWSTHLQGQSLADRYPVVSGQFVVYRSQPLGYFQTLLRQGDTVLNSAGSLKSNWTADWNRVRGKIEEYLKANPDQQTFFSLDSRTGKSTGIAPVLYTYGSQDTPAGPVASGSRLYLVYRPRHGVQTDSGTVHVTTEYDAELGWMNPKNLRITGLESMQPLSLPEFRLTSDEPSVISMGGSILWVDNWERLGGIDTRTGELVHAGNVSNTWPECVGAECGPGGPNPFFPITGAGPAYPFPAPRVGEGNVRGGLVIADGMLYWRVIQSGLAALRSSGGQGCPRAEVWDTKTDLTPAHTTIPFNSSQTLAEIISTDLSKASPRPDKVLVERLRAEISGLLEHASGQHLLPYYLERGMTNSSVWPYSVPADKAPPPSVSNESMGNVYWHDPGELLYTMAMAYPYLDRQLQRRVKVYMRNEMERYPPLIDLPWNDPNRDWLREGRPREAYPVPFRASLNNWPPPAAHPSALYALWLWSRNTGDWSYARDHWEEARQLFQKTERVGPLFYADLAGWIGMVRLAEGLGKPAIARSALRSAEKAFQASKDFVEFQQRADEIYPDPRGIQSGWSAPVFFGLTPEVGRFLATQMDGQPGRYLTGLEGLNPAGTGVVWWYLTRAGIQAEEGESSYLAPTLAWSHFLAHAYILQDTQDVLRDYLDRPWTAGDLYSIQKIIATIQAAP